MSLSGWKDFLKFTNGHTTIYIIFKWLRQIWDFHRFHTLFYITCIIGNNYMEKKGITLFIQFKIFKASGTLSIAKCLLNKHTCTFGRWSDFLHPYTSQFWSISTYELVRWALCSRCPRINALSLYNLTKSVPDPYKFLLYWFNAKQGRGLCQFWSWLKKYWPEYISMLAHLGVNELWSWRFTLTQLTEFGQVFLKCS